MENRSDSEARPAQAGLTTEDLAHPVTENEEGAPVYPGEATQDREVSEGFENREGYEDPASGEDREMRDEDTPAAEEESTAVPTGADTQAVASEGDSEPLLGASDTQEFRQSWTDVQGRFVDDPQDAVRSADALVAEVMQTLAGSFAARKQELEAQWSRGEEVETEDLRQALQHYRSFFNRLLKT